MDGQGWRRLAAVMAVSALASGCAVVAAAPEEGDKDEARDETAAGGVETGETPGDTGPEAAEDGEESQAPQTRRVSSEHDWDGGAVQTTTQSGVTFTVPEAWKLHPEAETDTGEEAVYLWQEGPLRYAECIVFNTGVDASPEEELDSYLDFLRELEGAERLEAAWGPEAVGVEGGADAVRADYSYSLPGAEDEAHGIIVAVTAATGEVVLFIVSGDGVRADEDLSEEIVSTLSIGVPPRGEV